MKILLTVLAFFSLSYIYAQPQWNWVRAGAVAQGNSVCTDAANNVYVFGTYNQFFTLDTFHLSTNTSYAMNMFLAKYDASGSLQWVKSVGGNGSFGNVVNVDELGNIYVGGYFFDSINFDGIRLVSDSSYSSSIISRDIFIAKYRSDGSVIWAKRIGGPSRETIGYGAEGGGMKVSKGYIYIAGMFGSGATTVNFDTVQLQSDYNQGSAYLAKYDTSGNITWAKKIGGDGVPIPDDIAIDSVGGVFITGGFTDSVYFDSLKISVPASTYNAMFLAKYDSNGKAMWVKKAVGSFSTFGVSLITDKLGDVIVTGSMFNDSTIFDDIFLPSNTNHDHGFIAKYSSAGNILWAKSMAVDTADENYPNYMYVDANNQLYITGEFQNTIHFENDTVTSRGKDDIYVARYDDDGNLVWLTSAGSLLDDEGYGITTDANGAVYVTGTFSDTCTFGNYTIGGDDDMFIAKIMPPTAVRQLIKPANHISVYPNPAVNTVSVDLGTGSFTTLKLTDCTGRNIYTSAVHGKQKVTINTNGIADGLYFITAQNNTGEVVSRKVIVQH